MCTYQVNNKIGIHPLFVTILESIDWTPSMRYFKILDHKLEVVFRVFLKFNDGGYLLELRFFKR